MKNSEKHCTHFTLIDNLSYENSSENKISFIIVMFIVNINFH